MWISILTTRLWAVLLVGSEKMVSESRRAWPERVKREQRTWCRNEGAWFMDKWGVAYARRGVALGKKCKLKDIAPNFDEASQIRKIPCEGEDWLPAIVLV